MASVSSPAPPPETAFARSVADDPDFLIMLPLGFDKTDSRAFSTFLTERYEETGGDELADRP